MLMNWIKIIKQKISFTISLYEILALTIGSLGIIVVYIQINQLEKDTEIATISSIKERYDSLLKELTFDINLYLFEDDTSCPTIYLQEGQTAECREKIIYLYRSFNLLLDQYLTYRAGVVDENDVSWQFWEQDICQFYHASERIRELAEVQVRYDIVRDFIQHFGDIEYCRSVFNID